MNKVRLNIKDKSVESFLKERLVNYVNDRDRHCDSSAYGLMSNEMIFKRGAGVDVESEIVFELYDVSRGSGRELINEYTYTVSEYDSVSVRLTLKHFSVKAKSEGL